MTINRKFRQAAKAAEPVAPVEQPEPVVEQEVEIEEEQDDEQDDDGISASTRGSRAAGEMRRRYNYRYGLHSDSREATAMWREQFK